METRFKYYEFENSLSRIDEILNSTSAFEETDEIPKRDSLTFTNGYYVKCTALFVDLRDSSTLPQVHQKKTLAKIYRSYISEIVATLNGYDHCKEINIVGDCVSAIFTGQYKTQVDETFSAAVQIRSLIDVLNYKLMKKGYSPIKAGIGLSWGRVLMIKAGYKGSAINDVVWMGDAVNQASKMCSKAMKEVQAPIVATIDFYSNLQNEKDKKLFQKGIFDAFYTSNAINIIMNNWIHEQKAKDDERRRKQQNSPYNW